MSQRLCFLSPDVDHATRAVKILRDAGIDQKNIYVIANDQFSLEGLPDGGPEDDDFLPALERGIAFGGATGLFLGLLAVVFPPAGIVVGGGGLLVIGLMSASLGGLLSGIAGAAYPNSRLQAFEDDIAAGKILVLADVALGEETYVANQIRLLDPETEVEGLEPPAPVVPR